MERRASARRTARSSSPAPTAFGLFDPAITPVSGRHADPGVTVHAAATAFGDLVPFNGGTCPVVVVPATTSGGTAIRSPVAFDANGTQVWSVTVQRSAMHVFFLPSWYATADKRRGAVEGMRRREDALVQSMKDVMQRDFGPQTLDEEVARRYGYAVVAARLCELYDSAAGEHREVA